MFSNRLAHRCGVDVAVRRPLIDHAVVDLARDQGELELHIWYLVSITFMMAIFLESLSGRS